MIGIMNVTSICSSIFDLKLFCDEQFQTVVQRAVGFMIDEYEEEHDVCLDDSNFHLCFENGFGKAYEPTDGDNLYIVLKATHAPLGFPSMLREEFSQWLQLIAEEG